MDYYANFYNYYNRLKNWYIKHGKLIVAFDFDDTVRNSYFIDGATFDEAIDVIRRCRDYATLICFTARESSIENYEYIKNYLNDNDIPFDYINKEFDGTYVMDKKIYYNILLDDKCGLDMPIRALNMLIDEIESGELNC